MMIRKLISLTKDQDKDLKALAKEMDISVAAVLRKMIDEYLLRAKYDKS